MSHLSTLTPTGRTVCQRRGMKPALEYDLFEQVLHLDNILDARKHVQANKGAPGVDGIPIEAFPDWASSNWKQVMAELRSDRPSANARV